MRTTNLYEKITWGALALGTAAGLLLAPGCANLDMDRLADLAEWGVDRLDAYQQGKKDRELAAGLPDVVEMDYNLGFGLVNHWADNPEGMANAAAKAGIGIVHISYLGWGGTDSYANPGAMEEPYRQLVAATTRNRQILFVEIANDNKGKGKYGDDDKSLAVYTNELRRAAQFIAATGGYDWLQPVGETQSQAGEEFEAYCAGLFPHSALVYNGGSRPDKPASWASMFAWHPADTKALPPKGAIAVSDHSGILRELYGDGWQGDAAGDPEAIAAWAKRMRDNDNVAILYSFGQKRARLAELVALRTAGTVMGLPEPEPEKPVSPAKPVTGDAVDYSLFNWRFGGENFSGARPSGSVAISWRGISSNRIDIKWERDLGAWGIDYTDHTKAIVCVFVKDANGNWVGGKTDWISSSRSNRDFNNIYNGYKGWSLSGIPNPTELAFVIVRLGGRDRSNVIGGTWKR